MESPLRRFLSNLIPLSPQWNQIFWMRLSNGVPPPPQTLLFSALALLMASLQNGRRVAAAAAACEATQLARNHKQAAVVLKTLAMQPRVRPANKSFIFSLAHIYMSQKVAPQVLPRRRSVFDI